MNKIFKVVWNHATQTFTVVSELAKNRGKVSSQTDERGELSTSRSSSGQISGVRGLTLTAISFFILSTFSHNANAAIAIGQNTGDYATTGSGTTSTSVSKGTSTGSTTTKVDVYAYNYYNPGSRSYTNRSVEEGDNYSMTNWSEGIAIGRNVNAVSSDGVASSVAIGDYANTSGALSVAIGPMARTGHIGSVAIGTASRADGFNSLAIMRQSAATSDFAMAMGSAAWADGRSSVAMGSSATAKGKQSFALGSADHVNLNGIQSGEALRTKYDGMNNTQSNGDRSFAIGTSAKTNGNDSFALGSDAQTGTFQTTYDSFLKASVLTPTAASAQSSFAMGTKARASQERAFALGTTTNATSVDAFALGTNATANQTRSIAFGTNTTSTGVDSFALGTEAKAHANKTVALGTNATSTKDNAFALGTNATATDQYALALGGEAKALGCVSVAIGGSAHATKENSMAIGREARSYGNNSIAMGSFANVASERSISIGTSSVVRTDKTVAIGSEALVDQNASGSVAIGETSKVVKGAENSTTIGFNSTVSAKNASAIGAKAVASHENAVALGSNSVTKDATSVTTATVNGITYGGFSGTNPSSVVSVGNVGAERQIVNVAAGKISSDSTDAINGSQLYATNNIIGNVASSIVNNLGGDAKVDGNGNITFSNIGGTGKETIHEAVQAAKTEVKAGTNTRVDTSTASDGHTVYTVHANNTKVTQGDGISVTSTTNAQSETSYTVALNEETKKQLKKEESASAGNSNVNVTLNSSVNDTGGKDYIVTLNNTLNLTDAGSITIGGTTINNDGLKITNGPNITSSGIDAGDKKITNVTAGDVSVNSKDAVNGSQLYATNQNVTTITNEVAKGWNITTSGNTGSSEVAKVEMGNTVTIDGGNNILLTQTDKKISIATSMTPTFTNVTTGNTVMNNDGLTIKGGPNVTTSGIDAGNKVITNVSNGSISVDSKDAVNGSQLYSVQESVKAAKTEVKAGTNTRVESASATDGHTIYTVHANNTKVTEGSGISVTSTTNEQNETSYTVALNEETKNQLKKEESASAGNSNVNVTLNTSKNSTGGNDYIVTLNNTLDLTKDGSVTIGGTTVNNDGLKITNGPSITSSGIDAGNKVITNVADGKISSDSKEAVNGSQLYSVKTVADSALQSFTTSVNGQNVETINKDNNDVGFVNGKGTTARNDSNNITFDINTTSLTADDKGNVTAGNATGDTFVKAGDIAVAINKAAAAAKTEVEAGSNIEVASKTGANGQTIYNVSTSANPTFTSVTTGNSVLNDSGLTITGGPSITKDGVNAGDKKITNVTEGNVSADSKEAVNGSQLYATNQNVTNITNEVAKGWNITTSGNTTTPNVKENVAMGDTVTIDGGNNILLTQDGKKISIATSMTPTFTNVTTGNTVMNNDGVKITGGKEPVTITKDGLNNGNNTITNVAPGANGTDAVNKDQLEKVNSTASAGWNLTVNSSNSSNVAPNATVDLANKDGNIVITKDANNVTFALNNNLTIGGKDGKIGLDGTNGTIGLNGKDGASANITVKEGTPGINGKDGETLTRIVYTDPNGTTHEVATLDDGLKFAGNKGETIAKKLGETLSVVGTLANESAASANNIRVDSENGQLVVKIAENPSFTSVVTGNTTTNTDGVTITGGTNGTVSVTKDGINAGNNTITNVANGTISESSKEAVNGSQLYATNQNVTNITNEVAKGWNITTSGNTQNSTDAKVEMGNTVTIDGGNNIQLTQDGKKITIATSMTPSFTTVTTGNTVMNTDGVTITGGNKDTVSLGKDGLNNGNNTITNVAPGVNGTDAVNKDQLDAVNSTALAGWNLTVNGTNSSNVAPNATVDLANKDGNIIITKDANNVTFALNDNITIGGQGKDGTDGKDGQIGVAGKDGKDGVVINGNGTIGINGRDGVDGKPGSNATLTVVEGKPGINGKDGDTLTRIVYTDPNGTTHEVATLDDGLKFKGNTGETIAKKLGETLSVVGALSETAEASANNIRVDNVNGELVVKIAENPSFTSVVTGNTTTNTDGVTITGGTNGTVSVTKDGINAGNNTITNVANGTISESSKDAVNGSQLYATNQNVTNITNEVAKGWNITTSGNTNNPEVTKVAMGDTVTIDGGNNINITQTGANISIATSMTPTFTNVTTGNTVMNNDGVTITGGSKDTVSLGKDGLNNGNNTITNVAPGVNGTDAVNKDQLEAVNSTASAGWNLTVNGTNSSNVAPNATVDLANKDGNIIITKDANNVTFALNDNITIGGQGKDGANGKDGQIGVAGKDGKDGVVINGNGTIAINGRDGVDGKDGSNATLTVVEGKPGIDGKDGDTLTRIVYTDPNGTTHEVATLDDGLKFAGNQGDTIAKKLGETLSVVGELDNASAASAKNIRVDSEGGKLVVKIAENPSFTSVVTGNTTTNNSGVTITGGENGTVSLTDKGLDNGNNTITNVAPGVNGTDAVNKDQLEAVNSTASAGWNLTVNGTNSSNVAPNATVDLANTDGNIVITKDANNVTFALNNNLTIGGKDGKDGQIGVSGKDGKDGVVINGNGTIIAGRDGVDGVDGQIGATGKDGASVVLNGKDGSIGLTGPKGADGKDGASANISVKDGAKGLDGNDGKDGESKTRIVYEKPNGETETVATLNDGLYFTGDNVSSVIAKKLNETLTIKGNLSQDAAVTDKNLRVDNVDGALVIKMAKSLADLTNATFTDSTSGITTVIGGNGTTITGGENGTVSLTDKGLDNGNNTITNVAPGVNGTDAVNKDQLEAVNSTASAGWNLTVNGTNSSNVAPNATVDLANKDGNIVITKDANNVTFALNNNLTIGGKDGKDGQIGVSGKDGKDGVVINGNGTIIAGRDGVDGVDGQIGATGKDGASVVLNGKDGSIGLTGPKGADGKDGASANISVKDGEKGIAGNDGKDGESKTRIVYEKPNGETETVATLNDGLYFTGDNVSSVIAKKLNETLTIKGNLSQDAAVTDKNLRVDNVDGALVIKMAKSLADLTNATFTDSTSGITTVIGGNGTTITGGANGTVSLTDKGLDNGNNTITNVAPGVNGTDAVNKDQLEAVNSTASAGWNLTVNGTNSSKVAPNATVDLANTDGNIVITKDANNVTFALNNNLTIGGKDGKDGQIGVSGKDGKDGVVINGNGTIIAGRDGVDGVDGQIGATGKDGASVVLNGKDGSIGLTGPKGTDGKDGVSANISVKDGAKGLDGNDGKDGESKTRIVYEKADGTTEEVATLNDGLIFTGNNEVKNNHKLNSVVKVVGEGVDKAASENFSSASGNINVKANGSDTLEIQLNKDVNLTKDGSVTVGNTVVNNEGVKVGDTSLTQDGLTIKDGPSITKDGINAGNKVITGVADGDISANSTEAVNGSQLYTVQEAAKAAKTEVKQGDNITVTEDIGGNGQSIYTVSVNKDLDLTKDGSVTIGNTVVNNEGVKVGDTSLTQDGLTIKDGPSITKDGINAGNKVITGVADGDISANSTEAINGSQLYNVKNELTQNAFGLKDENGKEVIQDLGTTVSVIGDGNVKTNVITKGDGTKALEVSLGSDILVGKDGKDGKDGSIGVTGKDGASVVLNGKDGSIGLTGPKGTDGKDGVSANISVKDGAKGLDGNDGKDGESKTRIVYEKADGTTEEVATLNDGLIFTGNNEVKNNHKLNSVVKVVGEGVDKAASENFSSASGNINVKANGSDTLEIQLNKDVNLTKDGSVTVGNTVVNNEGVKVGDTSLTQDGLTIKDGPSITKDGIDAGDKKITNVAAGNVSASSKDAVNGSQLYATNQNVTNNTNAINNVTTTVNKGWYVTTSGNTETSNVKSNVKMGDTVTIDGGKNIKVKQSGNTVSVATVDDPSFNSVTVGGNNGVNISSTEAKDGVKELSVGSTNAPTRVTNVAAGVRNTDAVNVGQLKGVVNNIDNKVNNMNKDLKAGIAGAMAAGNLYHATIPGKSMVAAGVGTYKGQAALSVGYSRLSDNGKTGVKVSFNTDSRGGVGAAASVGYQW